MSKTIKDKMLSLYIYFIWTIVFCILLFLKLFILIENNSLEKYTCS